jgi:hypothetical protein
MLKHYLKIALRNLLKQKDQYNFNSKENLQKGEKILC